MPKVPEPQYQRIVADVEAGLESVCRVASRRVVPYGISLELAGGGNIIIYNGKKGVTAVISGAVTAAERAMLEGFLAERGLGGNGASGAAAPALGGKAPTLAANSTTSPSTDLFASGAQAPKPIIPANRPPLLNLSNAPGAWVGSDEAGKGDYFGPLVVAAVAVTGAAQLPEFSAIGIRDSKLIGNQESERLSEYIIKNIPCEYAVLMPREYNQKYGGNLNILLGKLHAQVLSTLAHRVGADVVVTDQFARPQLLSHELRALDFRGRIFQRTKGEADGAVAAASVLARGLYLRGLSELSQEFTVELTPGAGPPVLKQGRELVRLFGPEVLASVGKLHFKTSEDILG